MAVPRNLRFTFGWSESDLTDMWFRLKRVDEQQEKMRDDQLYTESMDQKFASVCEFAMKPPLKPLTP